MEKPREILEKTAITLEKYKKNKTLIPPADLAGNYKVPFEKLQNQLKEELNQYLIAYIADGLTYCQDDLGYFQEFTEAINRIISESEIGKRVGRAALKEFDLEQVTRIAEELRIRVYEEAWVPYFQRHICLYLTEGCLAEGNPQRPRIYNSLVDRFWDEEKEEWIKGGL